MLSQEVESKPMKKNSSLFKGRS